MILWVVATALAGCGAVVKKAYRPNELRRKVSSNVPGLEPGELVVPYEVLDPAFIHLAESAVRPYFTTYGKMQGLIDALFSFSRFGLKYENMSTASANETLRSRKGNCLSLASAFIGLARAVGLDAYYLDVSERHEDQLADERFVVRAGHVTAVVRTDKGWSALDLGYRFSHVAWARIMDDMEAVAHFYNNRGYELIHLAQKEKRAVDWKAVVDNFTMATRIMPEFHRAWNNLGVIYARLGKHEKAERCYQTAIKNRDRFSSAYLNLGLLYLSTQRYSDALQYLQAAADLDSDNPHIHFNRGLALLHTGKLQAAEQAFRDAMDLHRQYPEAKKYLKKIYWHQGRKEELERLVNPGG